MVVHAIHAAAGRCDDIVKVQPIEEVVAAAIGAATSAAAAASAAEAAPKR